MRRPRIGRALPKRKKKEIRGRVVKGVQEPKQLEFNFGNSDAKKKRVVWSKSVKSKILGEALAAASRTGVPDFGVKKGIGEVQSKRLAKNLAELFTFNELFDRRRSFAATGNVFAKWRKLKSGRHELVKFGVDSSIYSLLSNGVSPQNTVTITREILSIKPEVFYNSEVNKRNLGNVSLDYSRREFIPKLQRMGVFPKAYYTNPDIRHRIERGIDLIIYLGFQRELSSRKQDAYIRKRFPKLTEKELRTRHFERVKSRGDVQELIASGVPEKLVLEAFPYVKGKTRGKKKKRSKILDTINAQLKKKKPNTQKKQKPIDRTGSLF
ncbi:MAG: hypothetical protein GX950_02150 [Candidatus Diapherotrites archaeon]|uniref:Uncharacterized protein n=1 Tax=Candidatus Iainarchaeum sp. TaxID=3101447 RepID=A0A7K4BZT8_9ARCH|nr:hypothetical protein [Candidatus Diapherotrites archaeon]